MEELVIVESYQSRLFAEIAKGKLDSKGVGSIIFADDLGGMRPGQSSNGICYVMLKVTKNNYQKAQRILGIKKE